MVGLEIVVPPDPPNLTVVTDPRLVPVTVMVAPLYVCVVELVGTEELTEEMVGVAKTPSTKYCCAAPAALLEPVIDEPEAVPPIDA